MNAQATGTAEAPARPTIEVHWLGTTLIAALAAGLAWEMGGLSVDAVPGHQFARAVGAWLLLVGCIVAHEAGHVLAGHRLGYRCRRIIVAARPGVELYPVDGHIRTNRDQLWISRGGPYVGLAVAALYLAVSLIFHTSGFGVWFVAGIIALCLNVLQFLPIPLGDGAKLAEARYEVRHGRGAAPFDDPARTEVEARVQARAAAAGIGPVRVRWHRSEFANAATDHARGAYRITLNTGLLAEPDGIEHTITHELGHIAAGHITPHAVARRLALLGAWIVLVCVAYWWLVPSPPAERLAGTLAMAAIAYGSGLVAILYREGRHGRTHEFEADAWAAAQGVPLTRDLADRWQANDDARHTWRIPGWPIIHPSWTDRYQHPANQAALIASDNAAAR